MEKFIKEYNKYQGTYSTKSLLIKVRRFSKKFGSSGIYRAILLDRFLRRRKIKSDINLVAIIALGYFISPLDVIPDIIIGTGLVDDYAVLVTACNLLSKKFTKNMKIASCRYIMKQFKGSEDEIIIPLV